MNQKNSRLDDIDARLDAKMGERTVVTFTWTHGGIPGACTDDEPELRVPSGWLIDDRCVDAVVAFVRAVAKKDEWSVVTGEPRLLIEAARLRLMSEDAELKRDWGEWPERFEELAFPTKRVRPVACDDDDVRPQRLGPARRDGRRAGNGHAARRPAAE